MLRPCSEYREMRNSDVALGSVDAAKLHLREWAERAQAGYGDLVSTLDDCRDLALHGQAGLGGYREPLPGLDALEQAVGQPDLVSRGHDGGLDLVAHGDLHLAVLVGQLRPVDQRLALAPHVDEDGLLTDL